jgi:hypothetical protein
MTILISIAVLLGQYNRPPLPCANGFSQSLRSYLQKFLGLVASGNCSYLGDKVSHIDCRTKQARVNIAFCEDTATRDNPRCEVNSWWLQKSVSLWPCHFRKYVYGHGPPNASHHWQCSNELKPK